MTGPLHETGVIHGRFQILHNDHLAYLLAGKALCRRLVVAITNPDPLRTAPEPTDPERSYPAANPLTYYERQAMIRAALTGAGVGLDAFCTTPLPISMPELYRYYVPMDAVYYLTIYDDWGREKERRFRKLGLATHVLWDRPPAQKGLTATQVRAALAAGEAWEHLVPPAVADLVRRWSLAGRLRDGAACS